MNRINIWKNNDWNFIQIKVGHKITDPGSSENTNKINAKTITEKKNIYLRISFSRCKDKGNQR